MTKYNILKPPSGLLGSVTKTAEVDNCPGKCIHSLAALLCDGVVEEVTCPSASMKCCVDKRKNKPKPNKRKEDTTGLATNSIFLCFP